jgi:hypothetical protein
MLNERLHRFAEDPSTIPPGDYLCAAVGCREMAINQLDVRYMLLGECFRLAHSFWDDGGAVSAEFAAAVEDLWGRYVPGLLSATSEEAGTALGLALREELVVLGGRDPVA